MFNRLVLLLSLPLVFLGAVPVQENSESSKTGPAPAWVKPCDFEVKELSDKEEHVNYQYLLDENQINWEEKTTYIRRMVKVLNQTGAEGFTRIAVDFMPTHQHVVVHSIKVLRNGEALNCLEKSHHKLLQREDSLENNIYHGKLTLVYFLNDIRAGDVVEYSYSIVGLHPFLSSHLNLWAPLKEHQTRGKIYHRLLVHPKHPLQMKSFDGPVKPKKVDLSPTLCEWTIEAVDTPVLREEKDIPSWYKIDGVYISQYKSWQDAVQKVVPLYALPEDFEKKPPSEMLSLVKKWTDSTDDVRRRALLALRFVQDEVKYMGFEDEIGGWKPTDPRVVFERRFGDCKDKSVLLHSFLKLMHIQSTPVLVDTKIGKRLPELLPRPFLNHAILRIEIDGADYWVDPTITQQGGSLKDNYCPEYYWGLAVSPHTTELTAIPSPITKPIEIRTSITMTSPETAELKIERTGSGSRAGGMRRILQQTGIKKFSEDRLEYIQKQYKGASVSSPVAVADDREKNVLTITESYQVSTRSRVGKKLIKASSSVLYDYLDDGINLERSAPYLLEYPLWVKERIHIENPFNNWEHDSEEAVFENEAIKYVYHMKKEGQTADFDFELKHLQDHVPVKLIEDYWNIVQEVYPNPSLEVVIAVPNPKP